MITKGECSRYGAGAIEFFCPEVIIGNYTVIAEKVIFCGQMNYPCVQDIDRVSNYPFGTEFGGDYHVGYSRGTINIGNDIFIGYESVILDGVTIGDGARIGMRTVVNKDVPPYAVVVGNPMIIKKYRFPPEKIEKLLKIKWWNWNKDVIKERVQDFRNIDSFIEKYAEK
ncbi:MAG: CatB-related O-acetyltransferase [Actinomycetota bacterium]